MQKRDHPSLIDDVDQTLSKPPCLSQSSQIKIYLEYRREKTLAQQSQTSNTLHLIMEKGAAGAQERPGFAGIDGFVADVSSELLCVLAVNHEPVPHAVVYRGRRRVD